MFLEDDKDASQELAANSTNGSAMMFALVAFGLVKDFEIWFVQDSHAGRLPESMTQVRGAAFTHVGFGSFKLAGLINRGINASISDEFIAAFEAVDITDLSQDRGAGDRTNTARIAATIQWSIRCRA